MILFIIVGMPASGKNIAREIAESMNIPYFATGDIIRKEVKNRGLEADAASTAMVSTEMRDRDGLGVTRRALAAARESGAEMAFMEGMRSWPEIELIRLHATCIVVAFLAPKGERLKRIVSRGRPDDSRDGFEERDMREIGYGTAVPIALADEYILNTGTPDAARARVREIVALHAGAGHT
ncbi:MAG TPA: AAA family ATPase [Syntrophorhabdaceae bacterium]